MVFAGDLALKLGSIASLHPSVRIGSYPNVEMGQGAREVGGANSYKVKLQFESRNVEALARAVEAAQEALETFSLPAVR